MVFVHSYVSLPEGTSVGDGSKPWNSVGFTKTWRYCAKERPRVSPISSSLKIQQVLVNISWFVDLFHLTVRTVGDYLPKLWVMFNEYIDQLLKKMNIDTTHPSFIIGNVVRALLFSLRLNIPGVHPKNTYISSYMYSLVRRFIYI